MKKCSRCLCTDYEDKNVDGKYSCGSCCIFCSKYSECTEIGKCKIELYKDKECPYQYDTERKFDPHNPKVHIIYNKDPEEKARQKKK